MVRTLGLYPRGSRFDPDRRPCLLDAKSERYFVCYPNTFARIWFSSGFTVLKL